MQERLDSKVNISYFPNGFQELRDTMYAFPLWAAVLQSDNLRFASNVAATDRTISEFYSTLSFYKTQATLHQQFNISGLQESLLGTHASSKSKHAKIHS